MQQPNLTLWVAAQASAFCRRAQVVGALLVPLLLPLSSSGQSGIRLDFQLANNRILPRCEQASGQILLENKANADRPVLLQLELPPGLRLAASDKDWKTAEGKPGQLETSLTLQPNARLSIPLQFDFASAASARAGDIKVQVQDVLEQGVTLRSTRVEPTPVVVLNNKSASSLQAAELLPMQAVDCATTLFYVSGDLTVDKNLAVSSRFSRFQMAPDARILVKSGTKLELSNTLLSSCEGVWKGIEVEAGGSVVLHNTVIEQASTPGGIRYLPETALAQQLLVSPNPANGLIRIQREGKAFQDTDGELSLLFSDSNGRTFQLSGRCAQGADYLQMDVAHLPAGLYTLSVLTPGSNAVQSGQVLITR